MSIVEDSVGNPPGKLQTLIIVADDVTGAADSAARCRHAGLPAVIDLTTGQAAHLSSAAATGPTPTAASYAPGSAVALSTDSRFLAPQPAGTQVHTMVAPLAAMLQTRPVQWYKKIDSTLRGNLGSEIEALLTLVMPPTAAPCAVISPAFPAQGRTLVDGYLCYAGLPPKSVHLPTLLAEQSTLPVAAISLATIRAGNDALRQALTNAYQAEAVLLVVDAETEEDLQRLAEVAAATIPHVLFCGSAGLVGVLARQLAASLPIEAGHPTEQRYSISYPVVAIVGSGSPMAHQQLTYLRLHPKVTVIEVDPTALAQGPTALTDWGAEFAAQQGTVVLHLPQPRLGIPLEGGIARQYAGVLAAAAQMAIKAMQPATLLLVGGDTAVQTLTMLGIQQLQVRTELLPGMPLTSAQDGDGHSYQIILKAGNHGDQTTLATLLHINSLHR